MSGPKVSSYELARRQQEKLRREREEQERRERERRERERLERERERERLRVEALKKKFSNLLSQVMRYANNCNDFVCGLDEKRYDVSALRKFSTEAKAVKQQYGDFSAVCGHGVQIETACEEKLQRMLQQGEEIETMVSALHQTRLKDQHEAANRMLQEYRRRQQVTEEKRNMESAKKAETLFSELMTKISELMTLCVEQEQVEASKKELQKCRQEWASQPERFCEEMHRFQIGELQHLVENAKQSEFRRSVRDRYETLCAVAGVKPLQYDDAYAVTIERACDALEVSLDEYRSKAYARQAIQECMEELGYRLVGERSDQGQIPTMQYLYRVAGTENVLRVTCSAGGQTVIEIGKGDKTSRKAEPREISGLVVDMKAFCAEGFPAIIKRLREKGVYLTEQAWLPPTEECAQIIDMSPFLEEVSDCSLQAMYDQIVTRELTVSQMD